jgi:hypothetical protein
MKKYFLTVIAVLFAFQLFSQKGPELGLSVGAAYYFGDIQPSFDLSHPGLAVNLFGRYNFDERISVKLGAYYGRLKAKDEWSENAFQQARNLDFFSDVVDGTLQLEFNFLPYEHGSRERFFTPYIFGGLSVFKYNPKTKLDGETYELREFGTENQSIGDEYSTIDVGIAYGGGLKLDINYNWSINFELSARWIFTDYLDDVSDVYADKDELEARRGPIAVALSDRSDPDRPGGQIGVAGTQRGNSKNNDSYRFVTIGVAYFFGTIGCDPIARPR